MCATNDRWKLDYGVEKFLIKITVLNQARLNFWVTIELIHCFCCSVVFTASTMKHFELISFLIGFFYIAMVAEAHGCFLFLIFS